MGALHKSRVSLRFFGDDLDPDEITRMLGHRPTVGVRMGGLWTTSRGATKVAHTGSWRLHVDERTPADLDAQIAELLRKLASDLTLWRELAAQYRADLFCGVFLSSGNEGFSLKPATMAACADRGLLIDFDIYDAECSPYGP